MLRRLSAWLFFLLVVSAPFVWAADTNLLYNGATVTIGSGAATTTLTFNSDAGTDGTIAWEATNDEFEFPNGILVVGGTTTSARLGEKLSIDATSNYSGLAMTTWSATQDHSPLLDFNRSRGTSIGSYTVVNNNDRLGYFIFRGSDGSQFVNGAFVVAIVDGTPGANDMPTRLEFYTTPDGSGTPVVRQSIKENGGVGFGTTTLNSDSRIEVAGHITVEGTAPTVSACGTTPSIVGNDVLGKVTVGTAGPTSCTLTFATAWTNAPACTVNDEGAIQLIRGVSTTTTLTIDSAAALTSHVISYICLGRG